MRAIALRRAALAGAAQPGPRPAAPRFDGQAPESSDPDPGEDPDEQRDHDVRPDRRAQAVEDRDDPPRIGLEGGDDRDRQQDRDRDEDRPDPPRRQPDRREGDDRQTDERSASSSANTPSGYRIDAGFQAPSVPVWTNGLANANPRTSNGVAALVNRSIRDSAALRTDNVVRIAVGMSWTAPTATPMNPNANDATDRRDAWRRRDQDDDRGQAGQEPDVRVTGERLDPPQDARGDEPAPGRPRPTDEGQQDPRQPAVGGHEVVPLELRGDGAAAHGDQGRCDGARPRTAQSERDQAGPQTRQRQMEDPAHVERDQWRELEDQPVRRIEGADLALGVERIAESSWSFQSGSRPAASASWKKLASG